MINDLSVVANKFLNTVFNSNKSNMSTEEIADMNKQIDNLFAEGNKYYSTGSVSIDKEAIDLQIQKLESDVKEKEEEIKVECENTIVKYTSSIDEYVETIRQGFVRISSLQHQSELSKYDEVKKIQTEVLYQYLKGEIEEDAIGNTVATKISKAGSSNLSLGAIKGELEKSEDIKSAIASLVGAISISKSKIDGKYDQIAASNKMIGALKALKNVKTIKNNKELNPAGQKPIYTAAKLDLIEALSAKYGKDVVPKPTSGDRSKAEDNAQLRDMYKSLGSGNVNNSILKDMFNKGFTYNEAAYAMAWIYNGCGIAFNPKQGQMAIPKGHDADAKKIYNTLAAQMEKLWGAGPNAQGTNGTDGTTNNGTTNGGTNTNNGTTNNGTTNGGTNTTNGTNNNGTTTPKRTDPIGFNNGNTSFDFVVDANNDNIFNGKEEFLGATVIKLASVTDENMESIFGATLINALKEKGAITGVEDLAKFDLDGDGKITGMEELFMYDLDGSGKINSEELDNLMVLKTVQTTGVYSFMSASIAGVRELDLTKFQSEKVNLIPNDPENAEDEENHIETYSTVVAYDAELLNKSTKLDINSNITDNRFDVNLTNGKGLSGYQRLDDNNYLDAMYGGAFGSKYTMSFNAPVTDAQGNVSIDIKKGDAELASARKTLIEINERLKTAQKDISAEEATRWSEAAKLVTQIEAEVILEGKAGAGEQNKQPKAKDEEFVQPYKKP